MRYTLLYLFFVMYTTTACNEDLLLPPPGEIGIPETLRVPPVEIKALALQAILDGTLDSIRVEEQFCRVKPIPASNEVEVKCLYPGRGSVEFLGEFASENRDQVLLGRAKQSIRQNIKLRFVKLDDYRFLAHSGLNKIGSPNGCKMEVRLNGEGRIYGSVEFMINEMESGRILLGSGGVYQGRFDVTVLGQKYDVDFISPGFYYRRDITPLVISPDDMSSTLPSINALQISLISSGKFDLNGQHYSYQDVFLEIFTAENFWDAPCLRSVEDMMP